MGKRGPRPDPLQAAKGFPARRKSKAMKAAEAAEHLTALLSPGSSKADLPPMLADPKYAPAAVVWRKLAPELRRTHRLPIESEFIFAQFCIYAQEWVSETEDLHTNGFSQAIATVAGGKMERRRPVTFDRQQAFQNIGELSAKFGLTPHDMHVVFKGQAAVAPLNPGLFGDGRQEPQKSQDADLGAGAAETVEPAPASRIGGMGAMRSKPPVMDA